MLYKLQDRDTRFMCLAIALAGLLTLLVAGTVRAGGAGRQDRMVEEVRVSTVAHLETAATTVQRWLRRYQPASRSTAAYSARWTGLAQEFARRQATPSGSVRSP